ncbi:hypothetical protein KSF78_0001127 [Schistosoma japonicum]|nr:hypothetical protein KSF78_0001127 [Schistosoma japonicum]
MVFNEDNKDDISKVLIEELYWAPATGATLGVLAILLVLFLLILCLPWHKCDRYCSCCHCWIFRTNENLHGQSDDAFRAGRMPGEYPMPMFDFIPPSALPKLPNYEECVNTGPPANDEAPPPPTPLPLYSVNSNGQASIRLTVHSQPDLLANIDESHTLGSPSSTPPPTYSSTCLHRPSTTSRTGDDLSRLVENSSHTPSRQISADR